jgi:membrane protein implicated in regulation of membrane protease activity
MQEPDLITRLFYPNYLAKQRRWIEERWIPIIRYSDLIEKFESGKVLEKHLPRLTSLLEGSIQPADFVKQHAKLPSYLDEEQMMSVHQYSSFRFNPFIIEHHAQMRELFDLAVAREEIHLEAESELLRRQRFSHILALVLLSLLTLMMLLILGVSPFAISSFVLLDDLTYGSLLLIPLTISLFVYSRLIRNQYEEKQDIDIKRMRLASAIHAYETYEDIHRIQKRVQISSIEAKKETRETEDTINDILLQREQTAHKLVRARLESVVGVLSSLKESLPEFKALSERERLIILRNILEPIEQDADEYDRPSMDDFEEYL